MSPRRAPSPCSEPGCPALVYSGSKCPKHKRASWQGSTRRQRLPPDWPARVAAVRKRDRDICYVCRGKRCGNRDIEVDHVRPGDDHDLANLACIGRDCHLSKSGREGSAGRRSTRRELEPHPGMVSRG